LPEANFTAQRQAYARDLPQLLSRYFDASQVHLLSGASREVPGAARYLRLRLQKEHETILAIGINEAESQSDLDGIVATGLLWLANSLSRQKNSQPIRRLCFCLPQQRAQTVVERLSLLAHQPFGVNLHCFEVEPRNERLIPLALATQIELLNAHSHELQWPITAKTPPIWRERIQQLAPELIEIRSHPRLAVESFSIHGLEFARTRRHGLEHVTFGVIGPLVELGYPAQQVLSESNFAQLAALVQEICKHRCAHAVERQHPFYRLRPEAWLESLLRRNLRSLDAQLDDRFVYSQIPAWRADERSVLDLLAVTHAGRLVVIEIKASEDIQLPFQGLDYWLRVEQARVRGELEQRRLFPGVSLNDQAPLLYLVAPRLRFHRSFATLVGCLAPEIEVYRLGLNSNWRAGIRVHTRERLNNSKEF
jgi:hypothetical protein